MGHTSWIRSLRWGALALSVFTSSIAGCASPEDAETWPEEGAVAEALFPLISTWYDGGGRKIYAPASQFRGTPNVKMTTRTIATNTCNTHGPLVMQQLPASSITTSICTGVNLRYAVSAAGVKMCVDARSVQVAVMYYNFTSATQTQLNYNVFDNGAGRVLDQSGWQPGGAGNGCPRSIP